MARPMMFAVLALTIVGLGSTVVGDAPTFNGTNLSSVDLPYLTPPYRFEGSQLASITFRTSPDVMQLTSTTVEGRLIKHLQVGAAQLTFESTPADPLGKIPVLEILNASYSESSFVLGYGQVVHDYRSDTKATGKKSAD